MKISHFPNNLPGNAKEVYPQLVDAIQQTDTLVENDMDADAALIWSVLWFGKMGANKAVWDHYRARNKPVIVIEVGGLIRNETWKLGINGINRDADFAVDTYMPDDRLQKFGIVLQPWKQHGEYILICGQHGHSQQWRNMPDMDTYYRNTIAEVRKFTDKPIVVRSHPRFRESLHWACDMQWYKDQDVTWNIPQQIQQTYDTQGCSCFCFEAERSGILLCVSYLACLVYSYLEDRLTIFVNVSTPRCVLLSNVVATVACNPDSCSLVSSKGVELATMSATSCPLSASIIFKNSLPMLLSKLIVYSVFIY